MIFDSCHQVDFEINMFEVKMRVRGCPVVHESMRPANLTSYKDLQFFSLYFE